MMSFVSKNFFIALALSFLVSAGISAQKSFEKFKGHCLILKNGDRARSCSTGERLTFWFVNNQSTPPGSGTFESPFPTLLQAQNASKPGDVIYVFPGDGTDAGQNASIVLTAGQQLLGATICQKLKTKEGTIKIPAQATGPLPTISDAAYISLTTPPVFAAVQMSEGNNVVSGLNLVDELGFFVFSPVLNSSGALNIYGGTNYVIKNNTLNEVPFDGSLGNAINIFGGRNVKICNNLFLSHSDLDSFGLLILNGFGITAPFQGKFVIKKNQFTGSTDQNGFSQGIHTDTFIADGKLCISIIDNLIDSHTNITPFEVDPLYGIAINSGVEFAKYTITGNTISLPGGSDSYSYNFAAGIIVNAYAPTTFANVHCNTVINKFVDPAIYVSPSYVFFDNGNPANLQFVASDKIKASLDLASLTPSADITKMMASKFKRRAEQGKTKVK